MLRHVSPKEEHGPFDVPLHEPRQRRSWLIFDVRQKCRFVKRLSARSYFWHWRSQVSERCFWRRVRVLDPRITPRGKFPIKSSRHSGEHVLARVVHGCAHWTHTSLASKHAVQEVLSLLSLLFNPVIDVPAPPNKTPEPTTFAVTSRAIVRFSEGRPRTVRLIAARAAPAKVVAHL